MPESNRSELTFVENIFEHIQFENQATSIGEHIAEYTPKLIQKLTANGRILCLPTEAWDILSQLIRLQGIITTSVKIKPFTEIECNTLCENTMKALSNIYNPNKPTISPVDEQAIRLLCAPVQPFFTARLHSLATDRKMIFSSIPGKGQTEKLKFVEEKSSDLSQELKRLLAELNKDEQETAYMLKECIKIHRLCLRGLLLHSSLFERAIDKKSNVITKIYTDFWREDPQTVELFLRSPNPYLQGKAQKNSFRVGYDCILEDNFFANAIQNSLHVSYWSPATAMAIGCNAFHKDIPVSSMRAFLKNIALLPKDKYKEYMDSFLDTTFDVFSAIENTDNTQEKERYDCKNLLPLITCVDDTSFSDKIASFFDARPLSFIKNMLNQPIDSTDWKKIVSFLLKTPTGQERLPRLQTQDGQNLIWTLYNSDHIKENDMEQIVKNAIINDDREFLMAQKQEPLTSKLPGYALLTRHLKNSPLATQFIGSFNSKQQTPDTCFSLLKDFVDDVSMLKQAALKSCLIPFWAKNDEAVKIVTFFYEGDPNKITELKPRLSPADMAALLTQKDADGKTAWHHFCEKKNRLLFGRFFKNLHSSFLQVALQSDNSGRSPIDYMTDSLKFRQVVVEKIPAAEKLITQRGMTLQYVPPVKDTPKEESTTPATQPEITFPPPELEKPAEWRILEFGNDKERRDMFYQALIRRAIKVLPPPRSESVNIANDVMVKKTPLGTSTFKIWHNNTQWRIPFVKDDSTATIYILPGSDRADTYTNKDYCRIVRNYVKKINQKKKQSRQRE